MFDMMLIFINSVHLGCLIWKVVPWRVFLGNFHCCLVSVFTNCIRYKPEDFKWMDVNVFKL